MKTLLLTASFFLTFCSAKAQNWGGGVDDDVIHFGFTFQYLSSEYRVFKKADWQSPVPVTVSGQPENITGPLRSIASKSAPGFGIGFVVNNRLSEHADVRFTPTLVFNDRLLQYDYAGSGSIPAYFKEQKVQATMVELPLGLKVKSDRLNNFRAYLIGNVKYSMDISSAKKTNDAAFGDLDKLLKNRKGYLSYEAGIGFDLYFEYFKMSPEIKYSSTFGNILKQDGNIYSTPIDKLMLRHVTFSLFFE